jgi:hypothetical protein
LAETKKTTVELDINLWRSVQKAKVDRGLNFGEAVSEALRQWLDAKPDTGVSEIKNSGGIAKIHSGKYSGSATTDQEKPEDWLIEIAREVLRSDHPVAAVALETNIISFGLLVVEKDTARKPDAATYTDAGAHAVLRAHNLLKRVRAIIEGDVGGAPGSHGALQKKRRT